MRIAVHTAWDPARPAAEAEVYRRMSIAADRLGWSCCRTNSARDIEAFAPNVVLAEHFLVAKLTPFPTLGLLWNPPGFWDVHDDNVKNIVSYDGHLFADRHTRQVVRDLVSPLATRFVEGQWFPTCQATVLPREARRGIAYLQTGWDNDRHGELLARIARTMRLRRYGHGSQELPFNGTSVLQVLAGHTAALCLHSDLHRRTGTPSARVFEAAAAGAVIISDHHEFVREVFGNAALYVDADASPARVAAQVAEHVSWLESHPSEADRLRASAHQTFSERFEFETLLAALPTLVDDVKRTWCVGDAGKTRSVSYIVRTGARDTSYLDRALVSLDRQSYPAIQAVVVVYRNAEAIRQHLSLRDQGVPTTLVESADTGMRSSTLWAGLSAVTTEFFGILDDDDTLLPNHVASCIAVLDANPDLDLAYSGTMVVCEDDETAESRAIASFPHFDPDAFWKRGDIYSHAWLARRAVLDRAGPDPELIVGEDYYLLLKFLRGANFGPTWRLTAEYRRRTSDLTHSPLKSELDANLDRVRRRLYFGPHTRSPMPNATESWRILAQNDFITGRILRNAIKKRHRRKGLAVYLADIRALPRRICRLPSILAADGFKGVIRRLESRGASEYARRTQSRLTSDR